MCTLIFEQVLWWQWGVVCCRQCMLYRWSWDQFADH